MPITVLPQPRLQGIFCVTVTVAVTVASVATIAVTGTVTVAVPTAHDITVLFPCPLSYYHNRGYKDFIALPLPLPLPLAITGYCYRYHFHHLYHYRTVTSPIVVTACRYLSSLLMPPPPFRDLTG